MKCEVCGRTDKLKEVIGSGVILCDKHAKEFVETFRDQRNRALRKFIDDRTEQVADGQLVIEVE